jgi:hypothetical protein
MLNEYIFIDSQINKSAPGRIPEFESGIQQKGTIPKKYTGTRNSRGSPISRF